MVAAWVGDVAVVVEAKSLRVVPVEVEEAGLAAEAAEAVAMDMAVVAVVAVVEVMAEVAARAAVVRAEEATAVAGTGAVAKAVA